MRDFIRLKPTMREIAIDVATAHGLRLADLYRKGRHKWYTHPRQEAMARMSNAGFSHTQIVRHFGLTDHTTSVHAKRAVEDRGYDYRVSLTGWVIKKIKEDGAPTNEQEAA